MSDGSFRDIILTVLKKDDRIWNKGDLNKSLLFNLVDEFDESLISILLKDPSTKEKFFLKAGDAFIFKVQDFKFFLDENKIDNSYTQFENQIGLFSGNKLLKNRGDVVLNFPFKDCILEGGQSGDEGEDTYFQYNDAMMILKNKNLAEKKYFLMRF